MKKYFFILLILSKTIFSENVLINEALSKTEGEKSIILLQKALSLNPRSYKALFFLANYYCKYGFCQNAITYYEKLISISPKNSQLFYNLGYTLKASGHIEKAIKAYKKAIKLKPNYSEAEFALALSFLQKGEFKNGWKLYKNYLKKNNLNAKKLRIWIKNNQLKNKRILLRKQGGFGDTMQFIRYTEKLKKMGAYIIVQASKPMLKLLSLCTYIDELISTQQYATNYDDQTSLMALPAIFNSDESTIPKNIPYLFADPNLIQFWKHSLSTDNEIFKIGYCFTADLKNDESRLPIAHRSIPINFLENLKQIENIKFYNLHKDSTDFGPDFDKTNGPFMDTAAIIKNLDLIITVDTCIAHLAGALGKPVWLLLPFSTDWRWINKRTDSPWYPTMDIFKQKNPFDWLSAINEIIKKLQTLSLPYKKVCEKNIHLKKEKLI